MRTHPLRLNGPSFFASSLLTVLLLSMSGCIGSDDRRSGPIVQPSTPKPGARQPDDGSPRPEPSDEDAEDGEDGDEGADGENGEDGDDPEDGSEDEETDDGTLVINDVRPVPAIPQSVIDDWRKTGGRSNVSQPAMPTPGIDESQCEDLTDGGPVGSDGCVTAEISCEQRIIGHTKGGIDRYAGTFYEKKHCWPNTRDHDGGDERVYKLTMPEGEWRAWATLYTPCADLDLAAVRHDWGGCPDLADKTGACEMKITDYNAAERIELTTQTKRPGQKPVWYIIVEGKNQDEGPFELHVQCREGVGGTVDP